MKFKRGFVLALFVLVVMGTTGCFWKKEIQTNEVGLVSDDGVSITAVVGAGRYTNWSYYAELHRLDASAMTLAWEDPDLVTRDKQPIGLQVSVTVRRPNNTNPDAVKTMWNIYRSEAEDDEAFAAFVLNRVPRAAKAVTTRYTLNQMLGIEGDAGREIVTQELRQLLEEELSEAGVPLLDIGINNISVDPDYLDRLKSKANAQAELELNQARTLQLQEQLAQEKAQTQIDLEKAKRENAVNEENAKVYEASDRAYELERLRLLQGVIGDADKIYFVPPDADLTLILGASGVVPVD
jgi:hypothetical protein